MTRSIKSKHSTESDTDTKKSNRWFRASSHRGEIEQLFDLYWGGKERRITGLTVRIIGVNVLAVICLVLGVIYLGQYHSRLVESNLKKFQTEVMLVTAAITDGYSMEVDLDTNRLEMLTGRLSATLGKRILIFDMNDQMVFDSHRVVKQHNIQPIFRVLMQEPRKLQSVEILKQTAGWVASWFSQYDRLDIFTGVGSQYANDYSDVVDAKRQNFSLSAWRDMQGDVVLTSAMPILHNSKIVGIVMLVADDEGIKEDLADAWFNILQIFLVTLFITIALSIYLSGVIARPLRKLAQAAENVRRGKLKYTEIPDMSDRHDEIGELSIVLRDMTYALWERMDTIEAFAADVAHEIKNPLTSLKSAVETAGIVKTKADRDKLLNIIRHDIERLDRLITDISNASRLDAELSRESFDVIDFKALMRELLDSYKSPLEREAINHANSDEALKDGVMITLDLPQYDEIAVRGSEGRLIQVFQNILSNALSFSPIKTTIKVSVVVKGRRVTVTIDDEGPGIPENRLKSIFERFYSERPDYEEYGRHSGLGLSICKQIITAHNGVIYAENRIDSRTGDVLGARFVVVLNMDQVH